MPSAGHRGPQAHPRWETCQWCGATILYEGRTSRRIRRRWVAAIAAAITLIVTQIGENAILGRTIVHQVEQWTG